MSKQSRTPLRARLRTRAALAASCAVVLATAVVAIVLVAGDSSGPERRESSASGCAATLDPARQRSCYVRALRDLVDDAATTTAGMRAAERLADSDRGFLGARCNVLMHEVGRTWALARRVTLARLGDVLPRSSDPGCAAGFAHGVITAVAPQLDLADPHRSAVACDGQQTRFLRYSCTHGFGHAFMRITGEDVASALRFCGRLGSAKAQDCAQGAFHDYWFAIVGTDGTRRPPDATDSPRALCGRQPSRFVLPCWYRAFIDTRPAGYQTRTVADLRRPCRGLRGLQREGCITATSAIGVPNPLRQIRLCASMAGLDARACIHGVKVQNLMGTPRDNFDRLIDRCDWFSRAIRADCYRWFGKTMSVVTNGGFGRTGCSALARRDARSWCRQGWRAMDGPLVTFS